MWKLIIIKKGVYFLILRETALLLGWGLLFLLFIATMLGFFGGWFLAKNLKLWLLKIKTKDRVLIFAPHPDDETLACGGLIAHLSLRKIPKKIVFLTVGDGNLYSFLEKKKIKYTPQEFIKVGFNRQKEALYALKKLGVEPKEVVFLGYPDSKLWELFKNPKKPVLSKGKLDFIPYEFSPNFRQQNRGVNLLTSLEKIIKDFQPTKIFLPHRQESNSDHKATFLLVRKAIEMANYQVEVFQYLIHFRWKFWRVYPGKPEEEKIIYPPKFLAFGNNWYSFWLDNKEFLKKKKALVSYKSQFKIPTLKNLFKNFVARNEIFEKLFF